MLDLDWIWDRAFPLSFYTDRALTVLRAGRLSERLGPACLIGSGLAESLTLTRPGVELTPQTVADLADRVILADFRGRRLQGEVIAAGEGWLWAFSPVLNSSEDLRRAGFAITELAGFDQAGSLMVALEFTREKTEELEARSRELLTTLTQLSAAEQRLTASLNALEHSNAELQARDARKDEFLAFLNHELRTPLHAAAGRLSLLQERPAGSIHAHDLTAVARGLTHLQLMLNQVTDTMQVFSGELSLNREPYSPRDLLKESADLARIYLGGKSVECVAQWDDTLPTLVWGDATRTRQILFNLASNAAKYTESGRIVISVLPGVTPDGGQALEYSVADTGIGIPDEARAHVFTRGFRAPNATAAAGSGYGLFIASEMAKRLGGSIDVRFKDNGETGSIFRLMVPCEVATASGAGSNRPIVPSEQVGLSRRAPIHVLLVEDFALSQQFATQALTNGGFEVDLAATGAAATRLCEQKRYDVVLMDLNLPDQRGTEATRAIRAFQQQIGESATPVVALTASQVSAVREECASAGINAVYAKPISATELRAVVRDHADRRPAALIADQDASRLARLVSQFARLGMDVTATSTRQATLRATERRRWDYVVLGEVPGLQTSAARDLLHRQAASATVMAADDARLDAVLQTHPFSARRPPASHQDTGRGQEAGSPDIDDLIGPYLADVGASLATCGSAIANGQFDSAVHVAHNIKGTARTFGVPDLEEPARGLEHAARHLDLSAARSALRHLADIHQAYMTSFGTFRVESA